MTQMLFFLLTEAFSLVHGRSQAFNDSFVIRVSDDNWETVSQKHKDFFVFFHADHKRVSDVGYLRYVSVAKNYADKAIFTVCPAEVCDEVAMAFRIIGFPSLYRVVNRTFYLEMLGGMSTESLDRFISNFTETDYEELNVDEKMNLDDVIESASIDEYDDSNIVVLVSNDHTKFGRESLKCASQLTGNYRILKGNEKVAKVLNVRFPSLVLLNQIDGTMNSYTGEPVAGQMVEWVKASSSSRITPFRMTDMHSRDGLTGRIVLYFKNRSELRDFKSTMRETANRFPGLKIEYADPNEQTRLLELFKAEPTVTQICIVSNYTTIGYAVCDDLEQFSKGQLPLHYIRAPRDTFGYVARTTELGFWDFLKHGPVFVAFDLKDCEKCQELAEQATLAGLKTSLFGSNATWIVWDVYQAVPSFREQLKLQVPSVWFFKSNNISEAVEFSGKSDYLDIIDWAHKLNEDFNLFQLLEAETGQTPFDVL